MRQLPKKYRQKFAESMLKVLQRKTIIKLEEFGVQEAGPFATGEIETHFGPVSFSIYDDWVAMQLKWHPGFVNGSPQWFKFSHWKVNFHTFASQRKVIDRPSHESSAWRFGCHLNKFFSDSPQPEELEKYRLIREKRDAKNKRLFEQR